MRIIIPKEKEREIPPAGQFNAVCYGVCDLGTQATPFGAKRQIYIAWELPHDKNSQGNPFQVGKFYTLTRNSRGILRQDLESWFGRVFDDSEFDGLDLVAELIGRTATIYLVHKANESGQVRAIINTIMLPKRGAPPRVKTINASIKFGLDDGLDRKAYEELPEWLRNIVAKSPEYQKYVAPEVTRASTDEQLKERLNTVADRWDPEPEAAETSTPSEPSAAAETSAASKVSEPSATPVKVTLTRPAATPAPNPADKGDLADDEIPF